MPANTVIASSHLDISQLEKGIQPDTLSIAISGPHIHRIPNCQHTLDHCLQPWSLPYLPPHKHTVQCRHGLPTEAVRSRTQWRFLAHWYAERALLSASNPVVTRLVGAQRAEVTYDAQ